MNKSINKVSQELTQSINTEPQNAAIYFSDLAKNLITNSKLSNEQIRVASKLPKSSFYYGLEEGKHYNFTNSLKLIKGLNYSLITTLTKNV